MKQIQFIGLSPEESNKPIFDYIDKKFEELKKNFTTKEPTEYLSKKETAELLKVNLSSVNNWIKRGALQSYGLQGRVFLKRSEVENAIVKLKQ